MVLGFEGGFVGSTYGANETQHGNRVDLEVAQPLIQAFGRRIDFHHTLQKNSWVQPNDEDNHQGQSLFQHIWRVEQSAFHGIPRNSWRSMFVKKYVLRCHTEPLAGQPCRTPLAIENCPRSGPAHVCGAVPENTS